MRHSFLGSRCYVQQKKRFFLCEVLMKISIILEPSSNVWFSWTFRPPAYGLISWIWVWILSGGVLYLIMGYRRKIARPQVRFGWCAIVISGGREGQGSRGSEWRRHISVSLLLISLLTWRSTKTPVRFLWRVMEISHIAVSDKICTDTIKEESNSIPKLIVIVHRA